MFSGKTKTQAGVKKKQPDYKVAYLTLVRHGIVQYAY